MKKLLILLSLLFFILALPPARAAGLSVSARQAVLIDAQTGCMLFGKNEEQKALIASTTKIMTALVVLEHCALDEVVRVDARSAGLEGSSIYLENGDKFSVETLLYGLMLESGNDAAMALAIHCAGSAESFVALMNEKAAALGMKDTSFANPSGIDDLNHYSTALDMAKLMAHAMENPHFAKVTGTASITLEGRTFTNHNRLLRMNCGVDGGKTGFTKASGRTLVSTAVRGGRRLVAVTLGASSDWRDHMAMYDYAESGYTWIQVDAGGCALPVIGALCHTVAPAPEREMAYPVKNGEAWEIRLELPHMLFAPLRAGEPLGTAVLMVDGRELYRQALVCPENIHQVDISPEYNMFYREALL